MNLERATSAPRDDRRRQRRLRMILSLTSNVLRNDATLTHREALSLLDCAEKAIMELFPDRQNYEQVILPHFERILHERWPRERCSGSISTLIN